MRAEPLPDPRRARNYSEEQYLRTQKKWRKCFRTFLKRLKILSEIARRCSVELRLYETFLPDFEVPDGFTTDTWFAQASKDGLEERLKHLFGHLDDASFGDTRKAYDERLKLELDVIIGMEFPGYFLIVADFIQWARANGVPVGPGRGVRRRIFSRLCPWHHRPGPYRLRLIVRTFPEPRAGFHA